MGTIRILLAFCVLASHADAMELDIMPGHVAVQLFFMISGFYMSFILNKKYSQWSVSVFYTNRLLRLFPTYLIVCLASAAVLYLLDVGVFTTLDKMETALDAGPLVAASLVWTNLAVVGQEILYVVKIDASNGFFSWFIGQADVNEAWKFLLVPQAWSLSMELWFYALAPFIVKWRNRPLGILFLMSLAMRLYIGSKGPTYDLVARRFFPAELCLFLTGVFSYRLFEWNQKKNIKPYMAGLVSFVALCLTILWYDGIDLPGSLALLAVIAFLSMPFLFGATRDNKFDTFLGRISYPVYMVHFIIVVLFETYGEDYSIILLLAVVCVAAVLMHCVVESPIDRWRQSRTGKAPIKVARSDLSQANPIQCQSLPGRASC
jgi:peptidoglycan/LPS O-acetylase OafA/YrhL